MKAAEHAKVWRQASNGLSARTTELMKDKNNASSVMALLASLSLADEVAIAYEQSAKEQEGRD